MQQTVDTWAREALARITALDGVRRAGLALSEGGGRRLLFAASDRDNDPDMDWCHIDAYLDVPLNRAIATGVTVAGGRSDLGPRFAKFMTTQPPEIQAVAAVPITTEGQTLGGFVAYLGQPEMDVPGLVVLGAELGARLRKAQRARARLHPTLAAEPVPEGAHAATHLVPAEARAVRGARDFVRGVLDDWKIDDDAQDVAVLLVSELVTNALVHTATGCELRLLLRADRLLVTVRDGGGALDGGERPPEPLRVHGRGLQLVDALSSEWGSEPDQVGTSVWFELRLGA